MPLVNVQAPQFVPAHKVTEVSRDVPGFAAAIGIDSHGTFGDWSAQRVAHRRTLIQHVTLMGVSR
ncbi:hypothetical protein GCM10027436_76570 [Actinophytocola sediminis]